MERLSDPAEYVYRPRMRRFPGPATARAAHLHLGWDEHSPTFAGKCVYREENGFSDTMAAEVLRIRQSPAKQ